MSKERKGHRGGRWGRGGEGGGGGCNRRHVDAAAELRVTGDGEKKKSPKRDAKSSNNNGNWGQGAADGLERVAALLVNFINERRSVWT